LLRHEGRGSEDETQFVDSLQLLAQFAIGINGKTSRRNGEFASLADALRQVLPDAFVYIVY